MEKRSKIGISVSATLLVAIAMALVVSVSPASNLNDNTEANGNPCFIIEKFSGTTKYCVHNTVTNIAKNQTRDIRMGTANCANTTGSTGASIIINCTWGSLMLSNESTAVNATATVCGGVIQNMGMNPVNGTLSLVDANIANYSVTNKFQATGTITIAKACLSNRTVSSDPLMASALLSTAVTLNNQENLTVIYYIGET